MFNMGLHYHTEPSEWQADDVRTSIVQEINMSGLGEQLNGRQ